MLTARSIAELMCQQADYMAGLAILRRQIAEGFDLMANAHSLPAELDNMRVISEAGCDEKTVSNIKGWSSFVHLYTLTGKLMRLRDPEELSLMIADHLSEIDKNVILSFKNRRILSLNQGELHNAWKACYILSEIARLRGEPLNVITFLDWLSGASVLIAAKALDNNQKEETRLYTSIALQALSGIFLTVERYAPTASEDIMKNMLEKALDCFAKYQICGLQAEVPKEEALKEEKPIPDDVQIAVQKLHDCQIVGALLEEKHQVLKKQLGRALLEYAEIQFKHDRIEDVQSLAGTALEVLGNSTFKKELADAYNLLGRVCKLYADEKNLSRAAEYFESSVRILEELDFKALAAIDHLNLSAVYTGLEAWFRVNPPQSKNFLSLSEEHLRQAKELGVDHTQLLHYKANLLLLKGDFEGAKNCWLETVQTLQNTSHAAIDACAPLPEEESKKLQYFVAAAVNLGELCFSLESGEVIDDALLKDKKLLDAIAAAVNVAERYPQVLVDLEHRILFYGILGKIYISQGRWSEAFLHYKQALIILDEHVQRTLNLRARLGPLKKFEYIFEEFIACCIYLSTSDVKYVEETYWGTARAKQRQFLSAAAILPLEAPSSLKTGGCNELLKKERQLLNKAKPLIFEDAGKWSPQDRVTISKIMEELRQVWDEIIKYSPDYVSVRRAAPLMLKEVYNLL